MDAAAEGKGGARTRRGKGVRASVAEDAGKRKKNVSLSREAWERIGIHAVKTSQTESAIVDRLIRDHLREFVVQRRGGPAKAGPADPGEAPAGAGEGGRGGAP